MKKNTSFFGNVQFVPGLGFVEGGQVGALGDDASVMMISGVGDGGPDPSQNPVLNYPGSGGKGEATTRQIAPVSRSPLAFLHDKYKLLGIELPVWVWILLGLGVIGAGYIFFGKGR